jgi:hypothetical protein
MKVKRGVQDEVAGLACPGAVRSGLDVAAAQHQGHVRFSMAMGAHDRVSFVDGAVDGDGVPIQPVSSLL